MSMIDPNVANLAEFSLDFSLVPLGVNNSDIDGPSDTGEQFYFALAYEGKNLSACAFEERLYFPINPQEFAYTQTRAVGTYDIISGPQATQLGQMQVRTFSLSSFFPEVYDGDYCIPTPTGQLDRSPQKSILWLQTAQKAGYPLQFMCLPLRGAVSIFSSVKVVISSVATTYRSGNPMDAFFDLEMTELIEPTLIKTAATTVAGPAWKTNAKGQHKWVTRSGDSLVDIARRFYGPAYGGMAKLIWDANKTVHMAAHPKAAKHPLRNSKGKKVSKPTENLLVGQALNIPKPKAVVR